MEKFELTEEARKYLEAHKSLTIGNWSASCWGKRFKVNNNGIKLLAKEDEGLEKIIFDTDKKTISVKVKYPNTKLNIPRTLDLSDEPEFFDLLRDNMETLLTKRDDTFELISVNEDRTEFEVKHISRWKMN